MTNAVIFLNNQQMEGLVTMKEAIDAMEIAFRELGEGKAQLIPRGRIQLPKKNSPGLHYLFNNIPGAVSAFNTMALRIDSATIRIRREAGMLRKDWPGDYVGLVMLFDIEDNELKAVLHDHYLSPIRVAATSAMVANYLAKEDSSVMGLFGSGEQAKAHAEAFCSVRDLDLIKVYSPTKSHREAFAREMKPRLDVEVKAVDEPRQAVEGSSMVVCATNTNEPVFQGEWLDAGTHVTSIVASYSHVKQQETDEVTAKKAGLVVLNSKEQVKLDSQSEMLSLLEKGIVKWENLYEVTDLVLGKCPARSDGREITVHYNNVGMGIQFAALGAIIYKKAKERGIGTEIPADLFITRKGGATWSP